MSKPNGAMQLQTLKPMHHQCIQLMLEKGESHGMLPEIAKEIGIQRPQTISDWKRSPVFMEAYMEARRQWEMQIAGEQFSSLRSRFREVVRQIESVQNAMKYAASAAETAACAKTVAYLLEKLGEMIEPLSSPPPEEDRAAVEADYQVIEASNPLMQLKSFSEALDYFVEEFDAHSMTVGEFADEVRADVG